MNRRNTPPGFFKKYTSDGRLVFAVQSLDVRTVQYDVQRALTKLVTFTNQFHAVKRHTIRGHRFYWKIDLRNAFDCVTYARVMMLPGIPDEIRHTPQIFFHQPLKGLIQGAPASPSIFAYYCIGMLDPNIDALCRMHTLTYTRYVDDLLFSSKHPITKSVREKIRTIVRCVGFHVNENKVSLVDTYREPIEFVGMRIYQRRVTPTATFLAKLEQSAPGARQEGLRGWQRSVLALN